MIKVYSTQTCPYCHALMDWLEKENIPYEEVDATNIPDIQAVPVTEINGERIVGFDRPAIKQALAAAKANESASSAAATEDSATEDSATEDSADSAETDDTDDC